MAEPVKTFLKRQRHNRRKGGLGYTIPGAARELDIAEGTFRRAIEAGEVKTVRFGGRERVPVHEIERIRALFGDLEK